MTSALYGYQVLDLSMGVAGPGAGMLCAQHGAEVTKIEPAAGDWGRKFGRPYGDLTGYSTVYNRGKRSLAIDLKDPQAKDTVAAMAARADVIIENFRPGVMKKFGLDYEAVRSRNPGIVYLSVTGFGQTGPMSQLPATDIVLQAFSGLMQVNRNPEGVPQRLDMVVVDMITALYGFQAVATALLERERFGSGKFIDCSLMKSAVAFQTPKIVEHVLHGEGGIVRKVPVCTLATQDGHLAIGVMNDEKFAALCSAIGRPELATDPRFTTMDMRVRNEGALLPVLQQEFRQHASSELVRRLGEADVLNARVLTYPELLEQPQLDAVGAVSWVEQDGLDRAVPIGLPPGAPAAAEVPMGPAPHVGQHSRDVLAHWQVPQETIEALLARGAVVQSGN